MTEPLIFELSQPGRRGVALPPLDVPEAEPLPAEFRREELPLPELSELDVVRHFVRLSQRNFAIDSVFYPLGSCTMKYNPKVHEEVARLRGFQQIHPLQPVETVQGALAVMFHLQRALAEISGLPAVSLQPAAGAQGELTGILMVRAWLRDRGEDERTVVLVPESAHGTNPATAAMAGFTVKAVRADRNGNVDLEHLRALLGPDVAAMMLTQPSTLGLFDPNIEEIARVVHAAGALLYGDGANLNAILGKVKPGDCGFDVIHINLHKTFTTPHGGGGPGAGPVCATAALAPYLPAPIVVQQGDRYAFHAPERTIGKVRAFYGHFGMFVRAYAYICGLGAEGLREVAEHAVLNANYLRCRLRDVYELPFDRICMHEVVFSGNRQKQECGVRTLDIAKRLIDYGFHPPTIYFPLVVEEALMIEPTETESRETLDRFIAAMRTIADEARTNPELLKHAPTTTPVGRLDEALAARRPDLRWQPHREAAERTPPGSAR
ncbi:MAG: putative glycine dehydrogenase (decarboxylating) subunit 2 [Dehalococcoidia bacterium]|nr:MAG: putative glycine dehydrogenase (decarboxylating) subunit 2 [Dehalococcoidia bacterium]